MLSSRNRQSLTTNHPLRGGKSMLYEGGVRVPLIVWAPDLVRSGVVDRPVSTYDFYPTLMELIHASPNNQSVDGQSFAGVFTGAGGSTAAERSFYWHYPLEKPHFLGGRSAGSIRKGDWKLIEFFDDGSSELYNLKDDAGENRNLAQLFPDKLSELSADLGAWRKEVAVQPDGSTDTTEK